MKNRNIAYIAGILAAAVFMGCETDTLPDPEVEYSPVWPISGEWHVHVMNDDGTPASEDIFVFRTYNTAGNVADTIWAKLNNIDTDIETEFDLLGKAVCNVSQKTFSVENGENTLFKNGFTITEGKVLTEAVQLPSNTLADSIYMRYTSENTGQTYVVSGHRASGFGEDVY